MRNPSIALLVLLFTASQLWAASGERQPFPSIEAEYFFNGAYRNFPGHKALAVGSYGNYGYVYRARNKKEANKLALRYCRESLKRDYPKEAKSLSCKVIASGNSLVEPLPWVSAPPSASPPGTDIPLERGYNVAHKGDALKGIILAVHGCDGLGWPVYNQIWGEFFAARGFDLHAPDSFAEPRPAAACGQEDRSVFLSERAIDSTRIIKLRIAQTLRSIQGLKDRHPGTPLYVWGHSEGGFLVQFLAAEMAGIIVTGEDCGIAGSPIAAAPSTPVLYMFGSDDPFVDAFKKPVTEKSARKCRGMVGNRSSKAVVIKDNGHGYFPWRRDIANAVLDFIGEKKWDPPAPRSPDGIALTEKMKIGLDHYATLAPHRAFAAAPGGAFGWAVKWQYAEDARQYALYNCAAFAGASYFEIAGQPCAIIDEDGESKMKD